MKHSEGGIKLQEGKTICEIAVESEPEVVRVTAPLRGQVIEVNEAIRKNPDLLISHPDSLGFLFILNVNHGHLAAVTTKLITEEDYSKINKEAQELKA